MFVFSLKYQKRQRFPPDIIDYFGKWLYNHR